MKDVIEPHANLAPLFKDRVVFVGQRSAARHLEEPVDQHKTPYTGPSGQLSTGVELQATIYCNLVEDEWLKESNPIAGSAMALMGLVAGAWFTRWPMRWVVVCAALFGLFMVACALFLFIHSRVITPWVVIAGPQLAVAIACAFIPVKTVFVSYRRADGRNVANFIANELNRRGVEAFIDIKAHSSGRLDDILFTQLDHRKNLIVVLTPGVIEKWKPGNGAEGDWIRQEIERAMGLKKNIMPVTVDDVGRFIETYCASENRAMPPEVQRVMSSYKRTSYSSNQPDASVDAIAKHLKAGFRRF